MLNLREAIEVFHLEFLRVLGARVDRKLYVLKGGCNLRFFGRSIRYSEDMDLDVTTMQPGTLRSNVDWVLASKPFELSLRRHGIELLRTSAPKQTDTAQRWKLLIGIGVGQEVPTKIEFSRRGFDDGIAYEAVSEELLQHYRMHPVLVQHYVPETAFRQKIEALAGRTLTQARDLFDLNLLLDAGCGREPLPAELQGQLSRAVANAIGVGYDDFAGQVLAYLEPEYQDQYRPRQYWETLQERIVQALERLQS